MRSLRALCGCLLWLSAAIASDAAGLIPGRGLGERPPTSKEQIAIDAAYRQVSSVPPNDLAWARVRAEIGAAAARGEAAPALDGLPTAVDNSTLQYFPPIRSQGNQGSCTAWASCYYYNTYTQAIDEGLDVSGGDNDHICSPGFMYPLINDGYDEGASLEYAMLKVCDVGCSSWTLKPYSESDYTSWPTEAAWIQALNNRTSEAYEIDGSTESGLTAIKQHLANGDLATTRFDVYETWYYYYPLDNPGIDNDVYYAPDGTDYGGHAVTLVGYDDAKSYVDHRDEETHYGAFLVANSWDDDWGVPNSTGIGGDGFFWVAYEMFLEETFGPWAYYTTDRPDYRPRLYGVTGLNHPERWDLDLYAGAGDPVAWWSHDALWFDGGPIAIADTKRVAIDLTDGIAYMGYPAYAFIEVYNDDWDEIDATMTSADFYVDLNEDGSYSTYNSTDPPLTIPWYDFNYAECIIGHEFGVYANAPAPATVLSEGTVSLSATYVDTGGHGVATWSWSDGGGGGSFSPSASVQNPTYTAPTNVGGVDVIVTLTVSATCNGAASLSDSDSTTLVVQPLIHEVTVTAEEPSPSAVLFGGSTSLSATFSDTFGHGAASWAWDDGGAGGSFSPSAAVQTPTYTAPANGGSELVVTLTVEATCDGGAPLSDSDSTTLYVSSVAHTLTVTAAAPDPATVESGGTSSLSATYDDSIGHGIDLWQWNDGGAGGSFSPSPNAQNPTYYAPVHAGGSDLSVTLTVTGTCDGPAPISDNDSTALAVEPAPGPRFTDIGATMNIPSAAGGAWGDYNDDGAPDLFVGGIWQGHRCVLYRNNGNGTFTDVTVAMGLHVDSDSWEDWGAAWGDFNNDGKLDLIVTGGNHMPFLYRNDGDHFTDIGGEAAGFNPQWSVLRGVSWGDYDADGWLDVYTAIDYYGAPSRLYRNNHDGTFTEVTSTCGMEFAPVYYGQSAAWFDFDNDSLLDLVVARKEEATGAGSPARMYRNNGDGTFNDWAAIGDLQAANTCHGVAPGDYNNDGYLDLAFTPARNRPAWLFRNAGNGTFADVSGTSGVSVLGAEAYGVAWGDYDGDGFLDLFMGVGGNGWHPFLFHNGGDGTFADLSAAEGMTAERKFRTAAWGDFDLDGDLDIFASAAENYSCLYRNDGPLRKWLRVRALTDRDGDTRDLDLEEDRDALGARVEVNLDNDDSFPAGRTLTRVIDGGSSFCGQNEPIAQFGLGATTAVVAVRVTFVDGTVAVETDVPTNQQIVVRDECQECGWIEGYVADAWNGEPIPGATVECDGKQTVTDISGAYLLAEVMPGTYTVTASSSDYHEKILVDLVVTTGAPTAADFSLTPKWGSISGAVRDASSLAPIAGATVSCDGSSALTEADGTYLLAEVRIGSQTVTAGKVNYLSSSVSGVTVVEGGTAVVDFALAAAGSIAGKVTDEETSAPIGGATISCEGYSATSAGDGSYTITGVPAGSGLVVNATHPGYRSRAVTGVAVALGQTTTVDFQLRYATGAIAGRVVDAATELPIAWAAVECDGRSVTSAQDGWYRFGDLRAGQTYAMSASADFHETASKNASVVKNATTRVDLALVATGTGGIAGRVTDADTDAGIAGALVTCGRLSAETDSDGSYSLANVPAGTASAVGASAGGYVWQAARSVVVDTGSVTTVDFALTPLAVEGPMFETIQYEGGWWPKAVGAAWGDYDEDGYPDLFLTGSPGGLPNVRLLRNQGDLTFADVGGAVGIYGATTGATDGVAWADYDSDGDLDVLVSGDGGVYDKLYRNDGAFFTDVAAAAGFTTTDPGRTVSWCDYDGDNRLDVFVSYVSYPGYDVAGRLYRNNGNGTFTDVSASVGMGGSDRPLYAFGSHWGDYDNDGWSDLLVSSWNLPPMLYHNEGDGTFTEVSTAANLTGLSGGTGAAWGDYDNDGWLDAYVVANGTVRDALFHNNGDGTFTNVAGTAGMSGDAFKANAVSWADYDNDGYLDIVVGGDRNTTVVLYHNDGDGTFTNAAAGSGLVPPQHSGATVWADIDLDGRLDLFHAGDPDSVMSHNVGAGGNWLRVRAVTDGDGDACDADPADSRDALGARVELNVDNDDGFLPGRTITRVIDGGSGFLGQNEPIAQFGVPTNGPVAVRVFFPDGSVVTHRDVSLNAQIEIRDVSDDRVTEAFPDVPLDCWAYDQINACVEAGVVAGYDDARYHGDWPVTRDQMAVYIARALAGGEANVPEFMGTPTFPDVDELFWALDHVEYAVEEGVVAGYDDELYHPEFEVDRGQMAAFMARAVAGGDGNVPTPSGSPTFPDVDELFWAYRHIEYCVEHGVVEGYEDGYYHPEIVVTRDQMAVYVARAFGL